MFSRRCEEYILCSVAYYMFDVSFTYDIFYDNICQTLALSYGKLPKEFTERVSRSDLIAGTGYSFVPTEKEILRVSSIISGELPPLDLITPEEYEVIKKGTVNWKDSLIERSRE